MGGTAKPYRPISLFEGEGMDFFMQKITKKSEKLTLSIRKTPRKAGDRWRT